MRCNKRIDIGVIHFIVISLVTGGCSQFGVSIIVVVSFIHTVDIIQRYVLQLEFSNHGLRVQDRVWLCTQVCTCLFARRTSVQHKHDTADDYCNICRKN